MRDTRFDSQCRPPGSTAPASAAETTFHLGPRDQRAVSIANYFSADLTPRTLSTTKGGIVFIADIHGSWDFVRAVVAPLGAVGTPTQHVRPIILGDLVTLPGQPLPTRTYFIAGNNDHLETFGSHRREELKALNLVPLPLHTEFLGIRLLSLSGIPSPEMETLWDQAGERRYGDNRMIDGDQITQLRELARQGLKFDILLSHMPPFIERPVASWPGSPLISNIAEVFQCSQVYSGHLHMETLTSMSGSSGKDRLAIGVNAGPLSVTYFDRASWDVTKVFGHVAAASPFSAPGGDDRTVQLSWRMPEFIDAARPAGRFSTALLQHCAIELLECILDALRELVHRGDELGVRDTHAFKLFQLNAAANYGADWRIMYTEALQQFRLNGAFDHCVKRCREANPQVNTHAFDPLRVMADIVGVIAGPSME